MSTHTNPFAEWNNLPPDRVPSIAGALPSIPILSSLPVFISDSLLLQFSSGTGSDVLNCTLRGPHNRSLFSISSDAQTTVFRTSESQIFGVVKLHPHALVEISGNSSKRVRDWLPLSPDRSCRYMYSGNLKCIWIPIQQHIVLIAEDESVLARITRTSSSAVLEITRFALQQNLLHPCIVAATLFLCGRHID